MPLSANGIWSHWKRIALRIGAVQARVILALLYFVVAAPFALLARLNAKAVFSSGWQPRPPADLPHKDAARRQF